MLQLPARFTKPLAEDFDSDGYLLVDLIERYFTTPENPDGLKLDPWQKWLLVRMLERYPATHLDPNKAGRLRYRQITVSLGRQNGKSFLAAALGIYGLLLHDPGATVVSLASSADQARIIYKRVLHIATQTPLSRYFKKATEYRGITTADGSGTYDVKAAKESAVQGIPGSLFLIDECHIIPRGLWGSAVLGSSSRKNGLVVGITTAGDDTSETLKELYQTGSMAIESTDPELERFGFFVWEAPENCEITDPAAIYAANPAVAAGRIPLETVVSDLKAIPEHEARRYRLNQFVSGSKSAWLPIENYHKAAGQGITDLTGATLSVRVTGRWEYATIAAAKRNGDIIETEIVASLVQPNEATLYNELVDLYKKFGAYAIALDSGQLSNLQKRLKQNGFVLFALWGKELADANSNVYQLYLQGKIEHANDPLLTVQIPRGIPHYSGDRWFIRQADAVGDIDALLAHIYAVHVAATRPEASGGIF
jgi:phage terminase large subunit-like protein